MMPLLQSLRPMDCLESPFCFSNFRWSLLSLGDFCLSGAPDCCYVVVAEEVVGEKSNLCIAEIVGSFAVADIGLAVAEDTDQS